MSDQLPEFIGLDTHYHSAEQHLLPRLHLDGAASPLAAKAAVLAINELLPHYSNTHSHVHTSAQICSEAVEWARAQVLDFVGADDKDYSAIFVGAGTTAAINRLARGLHTPDKPIVLVSALEHHANDLPHRQFDNDIIYMPLVGSGRDQGAIDLAELEALLEQHRGKINYLTFSAVSNVTGIVNPVPEISALAHRYGVLVLVDAAQHIAHQRLALSSLSLEQQPDFVIFSGHKIYCPTAPGVLIAKNTLLHAMSGQDLGGGAVADVSYYSFDLHDLPFREEAGTPNILGDYALGKVLAELRQYGQAKIEAHSRKLMTRLLAVLNDLPFITVYGASDAPRIGALSFTHQQIDHGLLAAILNDYHMIAVRNECFCAHPYVSSLLKEELWQIDLSDIEPADHQAFINRKRGMVRVSLSLYNSEADIERLAQALTDITNRADDLRQHYVALEDGNYRHKSYRVDWHQVIA